MSDSPLTNIASIAALVGAFITLLVAFGVPLTIERQAAIMGVVTVASPLLVAYFGNKKTTPLADPKDETGQPLVRANDGMPTQAATRAMAKK